MRDHSSLTFLKLGGSLITDKTRPMSPRLAVIERIAHEVFEVIQKQSTMDILIGHGSGSFGHATASQYQTHLGGSGNKYWHGFQQVWMAARQLNQIVIKAMSDTGLPILAFPPSAAVIAEDGQLTHWDTQALEKALFHNLIPIVQGDVIFDSSMGGTILSTEAIFHYLTPILSPARILLAGRDPGVYLDPDKPQDIIELISQENIDEVLPVLSPAHTADVTGGMLSKVRLMVELIKTIPGLEIQIFSGEPAGNIQKALAGENLGTLIR